MSSPNYLHTFAQTAAARREGADACAPPLPVAIPIPPPLPSAKRQVFSISRVAGALGILTSIAAALGAIALAIIAVELYTHRHNFFYTPPPTRTLTSPTPTPAPNTAPVASPASPSTAGR